VKILHATDTYAPTVGGIEVLVHDLAAHQVAAGHQVTVLTRTAGVTGVDANGVMVVRDVRAARRLVSEADLVHSHVSAISPLALKTAEKAAAQRVPVVATLHSMWTGTWPLYRATSAVRGWEDLRIQWAAVSEATADPLRRALRGRSVLVLPNAVDTAKWVPAAIDPTSDEQVGGSAADDGPVTIVSVMRMKGRKRPMHLLAALRRMRAAVPPEVEVRALLIGDGPRLGQVRRRISGWGMQDWVEAPGALSHHEIRGLYERAHVFVAPATLESFGIAALEARTAGLAVVARSGTGVADFVSDGVEGLLAVDDAEMAAHLAMLCTDAGVRTRIQRHNAGVRPAYDWSDVLWRTAYAYDAAAELAAGATHTVPEGTLDLAPSRRDRSPAVAASEVEGEPA
jgi:glycosyltransferase involved in cell wall biosynthesis